MKKLVLATVEEVSQAKMKDVVSADGLRTHTKHSHCYSRGNLQQIANGRPRGQGKRLREVNEAKFCVRCLTTGV